MSENENARTTRFRGFGKVLLSATVVVGTYGSVAWAAPENYVPVKAGRTGADNGNMELPYDILVGKHEVTFKYFTFTPAADFKGMEDVFAYSVFDGKAWSAPAKVTLTTSTQPQAVFAVDPDPNRVLAGNTRILSWSVENATAVTITSGNTALAPSLGPVNLSGAAAVTPAGNVLSNVNYLLTSATIRN